MQKNVWSAYKDKGVVVVGLDTAERGDAMSLAKGFQEKHGLTYPILVDTEQKALRAYSVNAFPTNMVIDANGVVRYVGLGYNEAALVQQVNAALKATPPTAGGGSSNATSGPPAVQVLLGGWKLDCEAGRVVTPDSTDADLFWEHTSKTERRLAPVNGAQVANLGVMSEEEFKNLPAPKIEGAKFSDGDLNGSDGSDTIQPGTVLLVRTRNQKLVKIRIGAGDRNFIPQNDNARYNMVITMALLGR